jgi:hypothetical protein
MAMLTAMLTAKLTEACNTADLEASAVFPTACHPGSTVVPGNYLEDGALFFVDATAQINPQMEAGSRHTAYEKWSCIGIRSACMRSDSSGNENAEMCSTYSGCQGSSTYDPPKFHIIREGCAREWLHKNPAVIDRKSIATCHAGLQNDSSVCQETMSM